MTHRLHEPIKEMIEMISDLRSRRDDVTDAEIASRINATRLRGMAPSAKWNAHSIRAWARTYGIYRRPGPRRASSK